MIARCIVEIGTSSYYMRYARLAAADAGLAGNTAARSRPTNCGITACSTRISTAIWRGERLGRTARLRIALHASPKPRR
jgi:hypothetical protein